MTVTCPRCATRYRTPAGGPRDGSSYRCTRCRTVFHPDEPTPGNADEGEPEFVFEDLPPPQPEREAAPEATPRRARKEAAPEADGIDGADPARFAVRLIVLVTLLYGLLSIYLYTHPSIIRATVGRIPLIGSGLTETRLSTQSVRITNLKGEYVRVLGDHLVFAISGSAVNATTAAVRGVQIQGKIVGRDKEDRQTIFCGTPPPVLENRSLQDILLFQKLHTPPDWSLAPGEQTPFTIVFTSPGTDLRTFAVEVVAVQAYRRRSGDTTSASARADN